MFRMWKSGEPNNFGGLEDCVAMDPNGLWNDCGCQNVCPFVCYNVDPSNYVFVPEFKMMREAQSYCRQFYTDLVSVRNLKEYVEIQKLAQNATIWIGLYRDSWKWSDGSPIMFTKWNPQIGTLRSAFINTPCVVLHQGQWTAQTCGDKLFFVCYDDPVTQQIVRVKVTINNCSVDPEDTTEAIMQQFAQRLKDRGLSENTMLSWRKQHGGKTFYLEKRRVEEEKLICGH
ncbi:hypothetical protein Q8A73_015749 [Channa argus]|nr:hypothetical protein Q8A73_015749 [Channa argus]